MISDARVRSGFAHSLADHGDQVALVSAAGSLTYRELDERVGELVLRLGPSRRLIHVRAGNRLESVVAYLAALRGGHPVILTSHDDGSIGAAYDPDVVIDAHAGELHVDERRRAAAVELHPDLAVLLSTSGTTGSPKLVRLSHTNIESNAESIAQALDIRATDRAATTLPMHYCFGLSVLNSHLARGAGLLLTELSVVDRCFWDQFVAWGGTTFPGVPHTFDLLGRSGFEERDLPSLRYISQAGGRLAPEKVQRFAALGRRRGWDLVVMYGQTEATARMAYLPPELVETNPAAIGVAVPGGDLEIEPVDDGDDHGELVYRGPNVMLGYAVQPSDLALGATVDALRTGDLARRNDSGLIEIVGRRSRFLKLFGLRVGLDDLETRLADAGIESLCGGDDNRLVIAVLDDRAADSRVFDVCASIGVPPARVVIVHVDELPRLPTGKPDYAALASLADRSVASAAVDDSVEAIYADVLRREVGDDDSFVSLGGDSLSYVELSVRLEDALGHLPSDWYRTPIRDLRPAPSPRRAVKHIETNVVMRAVAIVLVVGNHIGVVDVPGSAHVLLAVAGFNFGRFQVRAAPRARVRNVTRIALPASLWIALVALVSDDFTLSSAVMLRGVVGGDSGRWAYWFVEALVQLLVVLAVVLSFDRVRRLERRRPLLLPSALLLAGLAVRFDLVPLPALDHRIYRPQEVAWLFALGWGAAVAASARQRVAISGAALVAVPGFFGQGDRELFLLAGLLLLIWLPRVPVVAPVHRIVACVASASLAIYLTHWQVYPPLERLGGEHVAVAAATVLVGIAASHALAGAWGWLDARVRDRGVVAQK